MSRSAVPTLAAIATLVGLGAARADDVSMALSPSLWPGVPAPTEIFPKPPENWSDLPLQLHLSETLGYNSNIANTPSTAGSTLLFGRPIGAFESISSYGASFKREIGAQQFFGDASWGMYRYLNNDYFNSSHTAIDFGDNFTYGSKCAGALKISDSSAPSLPGQQIGFNVINTVTALAATENLKCAATGEASVIFNTGWSRSTNSADLDKPNDFQSAFVAAGMSYSVAEKNDLEVLATITGTNYNQRQIIANASGLADKVTTDQVMATYKRNLGSKLDITGEFGFVGVSYSYFGLGWPRTILPEYGFLAQWSLTPKLSLTAAVSRLASPPISLLSNFQITETASAGFTYKFTPLITVAGGVTVGYNTSGGASGGVNTLLQSTYAANEKTYGANASVTYTITPFLAAILSYQKTKSVQAGRTTSTDLILLALNFNPI